MDDAIHAIIRTQHITNVTGNVLTGGLAEGSMTVTFRDYWILKSVMGPLAAVRYHWHRLVSVSFNCTDSAPLRASVLLKYADWLTEPK